MFSMVATFFSKVVNLIAICGTIEYKPINPPRNIDFIPCSLIVEGNLLKREPAHKETCS